MGRILNKRVGYEQNKDTCSPWSSRVHSDTEHILHYVKKELVTFMVYDGVIYTAIKGDYSLIASSLSSHKVPFIFILLLQHKAVKKIKSAITD